MQKTYTLLFKRTRLVIAWMLLSVIAKGQPAPLPMVSGSYTDISIRSFLELLEKQSGYRFYYDQNKLDTSKITVILNKVPLDKSLQEGLKNTALSYSIDSRGYVYISRGQRVQTSLPDWFYSGGAVTNASAIPVVDDISRSIARDPETLHLIGTENGHPAEINYVVRGYVRDVRNGEPVVGASLQVEGKNINTVTDKFGLFTIMLPKDTSILNVQTIGMDDVQLKLLVRSDGILNVNMQPHIMTLKNVVVSGQKMSNLRTTQLGVQKLDIKTIKQVPVVFGEADIMRVLLTTPGVKTVGEASTGLNVRGGAADQNLILFNEANVYNPSHFFGMFSAFNPEVVKDVELFKGSIPAKYGGRLSSVVNINSREGNKKKFEGAAGIGLLTSRLQIEGPLAKDKSSYILAGRTTYADWLLKQLPQEYKNSKASFYDLNAIINHEFNERNSIHFTAYMSRDRFNLNTDTFFHYRNQNISLKWKHTFNPRFFAVIAGGHDRYAYSIEGGGDPVNAYILAFNIAQTYFKPHFTYTINNKHTLEWGLNATLHKLNSGNYQPAGSESLVAAINMPAEQAFETALYLSDNFKITPKLMLDAGLRYSLYGYFGPYSINNYPANTPKREENISDVSVYAKNKVINTYQGPEIRIGLRQLITSTLSVKAGYNSLRQYIHMLSNTTAMAPTDIWKLSDPNIRPQFGDQFSVGMYKNIASNTVELSVEGYYKRIKNYLDFKSGAVLILNPHIETDVLTTMGKAYGIELLVRKTSGKLNGWISYTYSRILLKADNPLNGEVINEGRYYPANYDKPHDVAFIGNYRISHRLSFSLNTTYSTGRPITLPVGRFYYDGGMRTLYANRNAHRIPDYFRTDFSMNIEGNHKVTQKTHNSWTIGVYNITGRRNPFSVYYVSQNGVINGYKLSIFGTAIPFINFNIKF